MHDLTQMHLASTWKRKTAAEVRSYQIVFAASASVVFPSLFGLDDLGGRARSRLRGGRLFVGLENMLCRGLLLAGVVCVPWFCTEYIGGYTKIDVDVDDLPIYISKKGRCSVI